MGLEKVAPYNFNFLYEAEKLDHPIKAEGEVER